MDETLMMATVGLAGLDALLSAGLLVVYALNYKQVKAPFTIGLMMFAGLFLLQNVLAVYAYLNMVMFFPDAFLVEIMAIMALEGVALGVMLYSANQ